MSLWKHFLDFLPLSESFTSRKKIMLNSPFAVSLGFETCWCYLQGENTPFATGVDPGLSPSELDEYEPEYDMEGTCCIIWLLAFFSCSQWLCNIQTLQSQLDSFQMQYLNMSHLYKADVTQTARKTLRHETASYLRSRKSAVTRSFLKYIGL